jgi:hypothetical protein
VNREDAAEALAVLRSVVAQTRDDTALQNWGVIWVIQGVLNGGGFVGTHVLLHSGYESPPVFLALWGSIITLNVLIVFALKKHRAGVRTFVESQLWTIWTTFIFAVSLLAVLNHLMGLRTLFLGPVIGVLGAVGFASMGGLMGKRWYLAAMVLVVTALAMAMLPDLQFVILGVAWGSAQVGGGVLLDRQRRRRLAASGGVQPARLV